MHDAGLAHQRRHGVAVRHGLAQSGEIRRHAVERLCTTNMHAETAADLVECKHRAVLVGQLANRLQKARIRRLDLTIELVPDGGQHDAGNPLSVLPQKLGQLLDRVICKGDHIAVRPRGHPRVLLQTPVVPAVVAAAQNHGAPGVRPRYADRGRGGI